MAPGSGRARTPSTRLMNEFGVPSYKQYVDGDAMMFVDGKKYRYKGTIPLSMSPWAVANIGAVFLELTQMCKSIPLEAPWEAPKAQKWDQLSWAAWLDRNTLSKPAHELLESSVSGLYTSAASEVSLLFVLYQMASAGGPSFVLGVKDAAEDARPVGGMGAIHRAVVAELGDAIHLSQPVRSITQYAEGVIVRSDDMVVRARRVVVAVPIAIASQIIYEPMLPVDRSFLHQRMPLGAVFKIALVYDEPFWRADGLSGQSFAPGSAANLTIDSCTDTGTPGVLTVITEGPEARRLGKLTDDERKKAVLDAVAERFGDKALSPVDYLEQNWAVERYSGGGMISHTPPGRAHRVRPRPARTLRPNPLGRNRNLANDVRIHRRSRPLRRARRGRGDSTRSDDGGLTRAAQRAQLVMSLFARL